MPDAKVAPEASASNNANSSTEDGTKDGEKDKKSKADKKSSFLLLTKTEKYPDDQDLYKPRLTRKHRQDYWTHLLQNRGIKKIPTGFKNWVASSLKGDEAIGLGNYPFWSVRSLNFVKSRGWDQLYLSLFAFWLLLLVFLYDGWAEKFLPASAQNIMATLPQAVILLPVGLMFVVQLIPTFGIIYFVCFCNDLIHFMAESDFGGWAFNACLVAQYVEFFFYSGRGRSKLAGKCKLDPNKISLFKLIGNATGLVAKDFVEVEETDAERMKKYGFDDVDESDDEEEEKENKIDDVVEEILDQAPDEEMGVLARLKAQKAAEEAEMKRLKAEEKARAELLITEWTEWKCMVCGLNNRKPTRPPVERDVVFGTKGVYYKRTYAHIVARPAKPQCNHCLTYFDYVPPLCSMHTFPYNPKPHKAFDNYPIKVDIQAGLSKEITSRYFNYFYSFFNGVRDNSSSLLTYNDWRLRMYLAQRFPELPRQVKPADELFQVGEVVECKQQKSDWQRARITASRSNHTYDIKYDTGDELRFVLESLIRLPPEKRNYAYRIEIGLVFIVLTFPIGILAAFVVSPGLILFGPAIVGISLLVNRIYSFFKYFREHYSAGCCIIFRLSLLFAFPLFLLTIASLLPYMKDGFGLGWIVVAYAWIATQLSVLPLFYMMRPAYIVFGSPVFLLTSAFVYLMAQRLDGTPISPLLGYPLAPMFLVTLVLKYYRRILHNIWDVCLTVRPPMYYITEEPQTWTEAFNDFISSFS